MQTHAEIFDEIYRNDLWSGGSGAGSREAATREYRLFLHFFLRINRIASVLDLGCGDWQSSKLMDWSEIDYTGVDASAVALEISSAFAREGVRFLQADATRDLLPAADLLIAKDVLQHWSNADILAFLPQLQNYRMALIINGFPPHALGHVNRDIPTGAAFRPVDPGQAPFNLPGAFIFTFQPEDRKWVFLWTRA